jgi:7-cyano-7-deazaguanine reductase
MAKYAKLKQLGHETPVPASPAEALLETVPNPHPGTLYLARFTPRAKLVESKSLKLYLNSFRNEASFHEDCTVGIGKRLVKELAPRWFRIAGYWYPRGGMPIDVFWQTAVPPKGLWLPDTGVASYRGRG